MTVHLDYETFSECNLRTAGLWAYARHPSTRILCVAWAYDEDKPSIWWPGSALPAPLVKAFRSEELKAFNANFELAITECVASKLGFPVPKLEQWEDTQAIARMCSFPGSLDKVSRALGLHELKDKRGAQLIRLFSVPQRDGSVNLPKDNRDAFRELCDYCKQDVVVDRAVGAALPVQELPAFETRVWRIDSIVNRRGVPIDAPFVRGAAGLAVAAKASGCASLARETKSKEFPKGRITTPGQSKRILALAAELGYPLENLKKPTVAAALEVEDLPPLLRNVLELRADVNVTSVAKYTAMLRAMDPDGRIRGVHAYHTATTGRWGGRIVQFQNLPRPAIKLDEQDHEMIRQGDADGLQMLYGNLMPVLRDALRNAIHAGPGRELHIVDKASIEARVLGWLADDPGYMDAFRHDKDLYKIAAAVIFNKSEFKVTDDERWLGKNSVLGQGYGMGWKTFKRQCKEKGGRIVSDELAKRATAVYRNLFKRIPIYWKTVEKACHKAIAEKCAVPLTHGIRVNYEDEHLTIRLPTGRKLWYPNARLKMVTKFDRDQYEIRFDTVVGNSWSTGSTYGGRLVENIVQAIARDLLAEALLKCEEAKMNPIMHVHDEIVCEPKKGTSIEPMHKIFRTPPPWAKGLPLGSSGFVSPFYKK